MSMFSTSDGLFSEPKCNSSRTKPLYLRTARSLLVVRIIFLICEINVHVYQSEHVLGAFKREW